VIDPLPETLQQALGASYLIERELGGGGMSRVFLAEEIRFGRKVVVKVLAPELAEGLSAERFGREIALAATLQEPHIVTVLDAGATGDGLPWYTMPFVRGESLRARLERGPVPLGEAVGILRDIARALAYAHGQGVVHRDIKPENVLLHEGTAVVTDFGIAKALSASKTHAPGGAITQLGTSLGTPAYMAPEQAVGDEVDHRADIYAWGVSAYEILAGAHPFADAITAQQLIAAHISAAPRPLATARPDVPPALAALVMQALAKDPLARPVSAPALVQALDDRQLLELPANAPGRSAGTGRVTRRAAIALVAAVVLLGGGAAWMARRNMAIASPDAVSASMAGISTVAVLPFVNTGGDPKDEYFSDGMTDELAHTLATLPGLRVAGRTSSYAYKGKNAPAPEIGRTLDVAGLVEGTVRRAGDRLRVTAQLTSVVDGKVRWSDSYERPAGDVFALQDELTKAIVAAVAPALRGDRAGDIAGASRGTANTEAYDLYLRGRYFWAMRGADNLVRAAGYFRRAAEKDPAFARAHAGLAMTYGVLPFYMSDPADTFAVRGVASATRALALDSTLADAHLALANALSTNNRPVEALPHEHTAIALEPQNATAHQWHGDNLLILGRVDEAVTELQRAVALDPLSAVMQNDLAQALLGARRFGDAIASARRARELFESTVRPTGALAYLFAGHADSAEAWLAVRTEADTRSPGMLATLALVYAAQGRWGEVERLRAETSRPGGDPSNGVEAGVIALALGDRAPLLRVLRTPAGRRQWLTRFYSLGCSPVTAPLLREPAFVAMLERQGLRYCPDDTPWPIKPRPG
jgi:TolB-like protein/tRNA A-37 threonylcarbamoyl transferase component Bud32/Flp pilus assembly protein TadD